MGNIAIIDIGSANIKMRIGKVSNDKIENILEKKEVSQLTENTNEDGIIDIDFINKLLIKKLSNFLQLIKENHCTKLIITGTHALRTAKNSNEILETIEKEIGKINIISSWEEGAIVYQRLIQCSSKEDKFGFIDVGGGSVQLSFGNNKKDIYSIPTGSYTLEKKYQKNTKMATSNELNEMKEQIILEYSNINLKKHKLDYLYFGSNVMENFTKSAFYKADIEISTYRNIHISKYKKLYEDIKGKEYIEVYDYFPENKMFMHGADKALLNLLTTCEMLNCELITPTNESLSSSLLYLVANKNDNFSKLNLIVNEV